ncbi:hypothetical protein [Ruminococcus albus]
MTFPSSIDTIEMHAFEYCSNLSQFRSRTSW